MTMTPLPAAVAACCAANANAVCCVVLDGLAPPFHFHFQVIDRQTTAQDYQDFLRRNDDKLSRADI